jgi:isopenicillin-N epimerase
VFLNHGSFGACPRPVFETYQAWQLELERQPVAFLGRRLPELLAHARAELAAYVSADADELVYFPNVTAALNAVAHSLPLAGDDEVLITNHEYGALWRTWTYVCEQRGARLVTAHLPRPLDDPCAAVEAVWACVTPRTRVLFMSHIASPTGVILPIAPLIARARAAGIWTVIDGAHAPGQIDLDLHALGADFYGANLHKWLGAPKGAGFLYARPEVQPLVEPPIISWGWRPVDPSGSAFVDQLQQQGTRDPAAYLAVPAAIAYQAERDWPRVRQECHALAVHARNRVAQLTSAEPVVIGEDATWFGQMAALPLPACDVDALRSRLYSAFKIEIPAWLWQDRPLLRLSVQGYNTRADVDSLIAALADELPRVCH